MGVRDDVALVVVDDARAERVPGADLHDGGQHVLDDGLVLDPPDRPWPGTPPPAGPERRTGRGPARRSRPPGRSRRHRRPGACSERRTRLREGVASMPGVSPGPAVHGLRWWADQAYGGDGFSRSGRAGPGCAPRRRQPRTPHRCSSAATRRYGSVRPARSSAANTRASSSGPGSSAVVAHVVREDPHAVPGVQRGGDPGEGGPQDFEPVGPDVEAEPVRVRVRVERGEGRAEVSGRSRAHRQRVARSARAGRAARRAPAPGPGRPAAGPARRRTSVRRGRAPRRSCPAGSAPRCHGRRPR